MSERSELPRVMNFVMMTLVVRRGRFEDVWLGFQELGSPQDYRLVTIGQDVEADQ